MPTEMLDVLALGVLVSAFFVGLVLGGPYIELLRHFRIGQNIRREGPSRDFAKQGIPTMGAGSFIVVVTLLWLFVLLLLLDSLRAEYIPQTISSISSLVGSCPFGATD